MSHTNPIETITKLFYFLDERRYEEILDLFINDGKWFRKERWRSGHADILASLNERPTTQVIRHVITNSHVANCERDRSTVKAYMLSYTFDDGKPHQTPVEIPGPSKLFTLSSDLVLVDGIWKIVSQSSSVEFNFKI